MRILHVIPAVAKRYGGPSTAIFPMCRALKDARCEVRLCTTDADGDKRLPVETNSFIDYEGVPTIFFSSTAGEFKYSRGMAQWLDEHVADFDVVHIHAVFNHSSIAAARACRKSGVPYIVRPLGTLDPWSMRQNPLKKKMFWSSFGKRMLAGAAALHYTAEGEKRAVEESLNVNHGVVVPLGVEIPSPFAHHSSLITHHPDSPYILFLSRLHKKKGLEVLIEAFASLIRDEQFQGWKLLIAGDGEQSYVRSLKALAQSYGAQSAVAFLGWLDGKEKSQALSSASLFVLPSSQENFGVSVVEAMAAGVPVLVSPQVNLADEIEKARAGWIVPVNLESLRTALMEAMKSQSERLCRAAGARSLAQRYRWQTVGHEMFCLYASVSH